jgi:hypothetical protein
VLHPVLDTVEAVDHGEGWALRCVVCHQRLSDYDADVKSGTLLRELMLVDVAPGNRRCREDFLLREYCCPGCGTAVAVDVQHRDEAPLEGSRFL